MTIEQDLEAMFLDYLDAHEARSAKGNYYPWGRLQTYSAMMWAMEQYKKLWFEMVVQTKVEEKPDDYQDEELKGKK